MRLRQPCGRWPVKIRRRKSDFDCSGTYSHLDLAYDKYINGEMSDADLSDDVIAQAMKAVP